MKKLIILLFTILHATIANSSHMMGGEITWQCSGGGDYVFTMKVYRDCRGAAFTAGPQTLNVTGHPAIASITLNFYSETDLSPATCGYSCQNPFPPGPPQGATEEFIFKSDPINLGNFVPPATGWTFSWNLCCRNSTIQNINNPGGLGMTLRSKMFAYNGETATSFCNNSPTIAERPSIFICSGYEYHYTETAFDNELDSLHYEWANPADNVPPTILQYQAPYTVNGPLPGTVSLNSNNGQITYFPPQGTQGDYVTCVRIDEYRCGVKISEIYREIQMGISNACGPVFGGGVNTPPVATISPSGTPFIYYNDTVYAGDTVSLVIQIEDFNFNPNPLSLQQVTFTGTSTQFGTNDTSTLGCLLPPCATLDHPSPSVFAGAENFVFNWVTNCSHVADFNDCYQSKSVYEFVLHAQDDFCPSPAQNNYVITIVVLGPSLTESGDTLYGSFPGNVGLQWYLNGNAIPGATNNYYVPLTSGVYTVSAQTPGACSVFSAPRPVTVLCDFDPTITGDTMMCPNGSGILTTQVYDSYQWYKRPLFGGSSQPIAGATNQTLAVTYMDDAGFYFSVEATDSSCTEMSPEVLVDGWAFASPTVATTGDFTIGPNGEVQVCTGDTAYLEFLLPYNTNITWFDNGNPIPGATSPIFTVTAAGSYTVEGAPQICPLFIQNMGIPIDVVIINCGIGIDEISDNIYISPNPANDVLNIQLLSNSKLAMFEMMDVSGRIISKEKISSSSDNYQVSVSGIQEGMYNCIITDASGNRFIKKVLIAR